MNTEPSHKNSSLIIAHRLVKRYRIGDSDVLALAAVSMQIDRGEMVAITGPSGSGKTTLMNIIGCLDSPDSGSYLLDGTDVAKLSGDSLAKIRSRHIGFVFQNFNLLPRLSALENVELPLLYAGRHDATAAASQALEMVGLGNRLKHEPSQLSGGQRQRVAIARALANNPDIILADEPTGNLDSRAGRDILELFHRLHDQGRTIVIVTHDAGVARHCGREMQIRDGRIVIQIEHAHIGRNELMATA